MLSMLSKTPIITLNERRTLYFDYPCSHTIRTLCTRSRITSSSVSDRWRRVQHESCVPAILSERTQRTPPAAKVTNKRKTLVVSSRHLSAQRERMNAYVHTHSPRISRTYAPDEVTRAPLAQTHTHTPHTVIQCTRSAAVMRTQCGASSAR